MADDMVLEGEIEDTIHQVILACGERPLKEKVTMLYLTVDYIFQHNRELIFNFKKDMEGNIDMKTQKDIAMVKSELCNVILNMIYGDINDITDDSREYLWELRVKIMNSKY